MPNLPNIIKNGDRRIGLALLGSGTVFTMLGISLFFNKSLMRLGNLLFIGGVPMTIGPGRTAGYFFQPKKSRATACLALGIFLVFIGSPVIGIILEIFGVLNLFGNMFPLVTAIMRQMPVVGPLFGGGSGGNRRPTRSTRDDDDDRHDDYRHTDSYDDRYDDDRYSRSGRGDSHDADDRNGPERYY
jgi:Got1/Sft2-like family